MDARFRGRRHDHERDPARLEVALESRDRHARIGFWRCRPLGCAGDPLPALSRVEETAAGEVLDVRAIEEPAVAAGIDALVAGTEPAGHEDLRGWPQRPPDHRLVLERALESAESGEDGSIRGDDEPPEAGALRLRGRRIRTGTNLPGSCARWDQAVAVPSALRARTTASSAIGTAAIIARKNAMRRRTVNGATSVWPRSLRATSSRLRPPDGSGCRGVDIRR